MARKLKKKTGPAAQKTTRSPNDDAIIEQTAAFSAAFNEWGAALLTLPATTSDAVAASLGDFVGQIWNLAAGPGAIDDVATTLLQSPPRPAAWEEGSDAARTEAIVRTLVTARREHFATEARLVEAVVLQHLGGRRFYLALPVGWDAALG